MYLDSAGPDRTRIASGVVCYDGNGNGWDEYTDTDRYRERSRDGMGWCGLESRV